MTAGGIMLNQHAKLDDVARAASRKGKTGSMLGGAGVILAALGLAKGSYRIGANSQIRHANQVNAAMAEKTASEIVEATQAKPRDFKKERGYVG
jgi:uncharacterized protein HemX